LLNDLFDQKMTIGLCGNLCLMRHAEDLKSFSKIFEPVADEFNGRTADARIDLIENKCGVALLFLGKNPKRSLKEVGALSPGWEKEEK